MTIWFTSDLHFGHKVMAAKHRPQFGTIEKMDEVLIAKWNSKISDYDSVYILGDVSFHKPGPTIGILNRLHGEKFLVRGNHDKKMPAQVEALYSWIKDYHVLKHEGQKYVLMHFPILSWDGMHKGSYMLHGHSHNNLRFEDIKRLDVGVDGNLFFPWSIDEVNAKLSVRGFKQVDHHTEHHD